MMEKECPTVVITGAGSGIGAACALSLDQLGWRVFAGVLPMIQHRSFAQPASPFDLLLAQGKLSRRTVLRNIAGVALVGGGLIPFTTSCGTAPSRPSTASQTPPSHALGKSIYTYRGHSSHVNAVAWSPDGKRIASGSFGQTVQVWEANTGGRFLTYHGHSDAVLAVAWSPDGKRIASGSGQLGTPATDKTVQVWDAATGNHVFTYRGHSASVLAVVWSPDGKRIASGSFDQTVQVWQAQ